MRETRHRGGVAVAAEAADADELLKAVAGFRGRPGGLRSSALAGIEDLTTLERRVGLLAGLPKIMSTWRAECGS
jgi:hypothetical protein